jgi:hypothetical protein
LTILFCQLPMLATLRTPMIDASATVTDAFFASYVPDRIDFGDAGFAVAACFVTLLEAAALLATAIVDSFVRLCSVWNDVPSKAFVPVAAVLDETIRLLDDAATSSRLSQLAKCCNCSINDASLVRRPLLCSNHSELQLLLCRQMISLLLLFCRSVDALDDIRSISSIARSAVDGISNVPMLRTNLICVY